MEQEEVLDNTDKDIAHNWVSSSRFLFYCQVFLLVALLTGGCYALYKHHYTGHPDVNVPDNTLFNPKYK